MDLIDLKYFIKKIDETSVQKFFETGELDEAGKKALTFFLRILMRHKKNIDTLQKETFETIEHTYKKYGRNLPMECGSLMKMESLSIATMLMRILLSCRNQNWKTNPLL